MSRRCDLTGKGAMVGHKVSHSNIKTKVRFLPNLRNVTLISEALGRSVKLRVAAASRCSGASLRISPPQSSGTRPFSCNCWRTRSGLAFGWSHLFTATRIGTFAACAGAGMPASSAIVAAAVAIARIPVVPALLVAYGRNAAAWAGHAGEIIFVGEGLQASVAVSRLADGSLNYHNAGKIQASSMPQDMRLQRMLGHLTTLIPRQAKSVLVIGCGAGVTAGAVSVSPKVERVTIAEIEPLVPAVVSTHFASVNHAVISNPKVHVHIDDARHFLGTTDERFDAITSDPLDPWVKGAAALYTREFWELAKSRLKPGGVVTVFVQLYESSPEAVKSEIATFFEVFPNGLIFGNTWDGHAEDTVLVGTIDPPYVDVNAMEAGFQQPEYLPVRQSLGEIGIYSVVDLLGRYAGRAPELRPYLADAAINRDRDLRLQYLAGLGFNQHLGREIYQDILQYRRFPDDIFVATDPHLGWLRAAIEQPAE